MKTIFPTKSNHASFLLSPERSPKQITVTWEEQHVDGNVEDGIDEFRGDQLKLCPARRSRRGRPISFDVGRQSQDVTLLILRGLK